MAARRRKLLLADDSPTIQKVVHLTFSDEGMEVTAVGTGAEALAAIERSRPDVVLADVHMPGVGGYELCERIKRDATLADIPVVLLVGSFEPFSEAEARRVGADEVLTKPFQSIRELVGKVGSLFGGKQPAETPAEEASAAAPPRADDARDERRMATDARAEAHTPAPQMQTAEAAPRAAETASGFNDLDMDDQMIEARTPEGFGRADAPEEMTHMGMTAQGEEPAAETASDEGFSRAFDAPVGGFEEEGRGVEVESREVKVEASAAVARSAEPVFASRLASAAAADDALLDLGRIESTPTVDESDDFVLDLDEETPYAFSAPARRETERAATSFPFGAREADAHDARADAAGAFAEAAHGIGASEAASSAGEAALSSEATPSFAESDDAAHAESNAPAYEELAAEVSREPYGEDGSTFAQGSSASAPREFIEPRVVPSDEPEHADGAHAVEDLSVEGDIARPPLATHAQSDESAPAQSAESASATPAARLDAGQFPPEVIEQIARRAVELLSEREVREIAWEVVPELAERLIKQRLDEIAQK
ncbi:MAG TPA: response regulator [Pyrinomonadaceae bacterium]|nr:response regulator [Pyrinomonadaceae bacterium]